MLKRIWILTGLLLLFLTGSIALNQINNQMQPAKLRILCAGSLLYPLERVAEAYMVDNPRVTVEVEGHGSIQVIRHITELHDSADLLLVADYGLIPLMMYNVTEPESDEPYSDFYIRFAGNRVVLAYTDSSRYADEVNSSNWYEVLGRDGVKYGAPNPLIDALGYRALMMLQLAESYYDEPSIFDKLYGFNFHPDFETVQIPGKTVIFVPDVQKPINDKVTLRASSIQLAPLLDSGSLDYCILYESNARQYGYRYVELPAEIDLGSDAMFESYAKVEVRFLHARYGSIGLDRPGNVIHYGLTIPVNAPNPGEAERFTSYLLKGEGKEVFNSLWHPIYEEVYTDYPGNLPDSLVTLVEKDATG